MKGGQSQRREVECGEEVPSPLKKGSEGGAVPPPQKLKKKFWFNVFKKFLCSDQRGGGIAQCPPKYATVRGCSSQNPTQSNP